MCLISKSKPAQSVFFFLSIFYFIFSFYFFFFALQIFEYDNNFLQIQFEFYPVFDHILRLPLYDIYQSHRCFFQILPKQCWYVPHITMARPGGIYKHIYIYKNDKCKCKIVNVLTCTLNLPIRANYVIIPYNSNSAADQRLCFRYIDTFIPLLPKSEISSF